MNETHYLTTKSAAELTGFAPGTLQNWRVLQVGPEFIKLPNGSVRYRLADLISYVESFANRPEPRS